MHIGQYELIINEPIENGEFDCKFATTIKREDVIKMRFIHKNEITLEELLDGIFLKGLLFIKRNNSN